jgi:hypothetical protein
LLLLNGWEGGWLSVFAMPVRQKRGKVILSDFGKKYPVAFVGLTPAVILELSGGNTAYGG